VDEGCTARLEFHNKSTGALLHTHAFTGKGNTLVTNYASSGADHPAIQHGANGEMLDLFAFDGVMRFLSLTVVSDVCTLLPDTAASLKRVDVLNPVTMKSTSTPRTMRSDPLHQTLVLPPVTFNLAARDICLPS